MTANNTLQLLRGRLNRSTERLFQLATKLDAPPTIIANEIAMAMRQAFALYPDEMGHALGTFLGHPLRNWHGACERCGRDLHEPSIRGCTVCDAEDEECHKPVDLMQAILDSDPDSNNEEDSNAL